MPSNPMAKRKEPVGTCTQASSTAEEVAMYGTFRSDFFEFAWIEFPPATGTT